MRASVRAVLLVTAVLLATLPVPTRLMASPIAGTLTVKAFFDRLDGTISKLRESASSLMEQGNAELAQQQLLLADTLKATVDRLRDAYAASIDKTFDQISVAEKNTFSQLNETLEHADEIRKGTFADTRTVIYQAQAASNQLLDRLPLTRKYPVYYGFETRDLFGSPDQSDVDVVILGFFLVDPRLNKQPTIKIADRTLAPKDFGVQSDRIKIQLPDSIRQQLQFQNSACAPRKTFTVELTTYYYVTRGYWPITWKQEAEAHFRGNALPGDTRFEAAATYEGTLTALVDQPGAFDVASQQVNVGCEQSAPASVSSPLPEGAFEVSANCQWINTDNLKSQPCTAVPGNPATATGTAHGLDKDWLGNCRGGGHGALRLYGSYKTKQSQVAASNGSLPSVVLVSGRSASATLPDNGSTLTAVSVELRRRNCSTVYDSAAINAPRNPNERVKQTSGQGHFETTLERRSLVVRSLDK